MVGKNAQSEGRQVHIQSVNKGVSKCFAVSLSDGVMELCVQVVTEFCFRMM